MRPSTFSSMNKLAFPQAPRALDPDEPYFNSNLGGTLNLDVEKDMHIHGLEIAFQKDGRVTSAWEGYQGGKKAGTTSFRIDAEMRRGPLGLPGVSVPP